MTVAIPCNLRHNEWILCVPGPKLTSPEFMQLSAENRDLRLEMTAAGAVLVKEKQGGMHGHRSFNLTGRFGNWAEAEGSGMAFGADTGFTLPNSAVRAPDLSWIKLERWEALSEAEKNSFAPLCPEFVAIIRCWSDPLPALQEQMQEYIENGAQLGWLIDPLEKKVHVYRPGAPVEILDNPSEVSGEPLLPGFVLKLAGILD